MSTFDKKQTNKNEKWNEVTILNTVSKLSTVMLNSKLRIMLFLAQINLTIQEPLYSQNSGSIPPKTWQ